VYTNEDDDDTSPTLAASGDSAGSLSTGSAAAAADADTIQYNIRLLHRSQTATTSNMKQMKTKYNSRIT